MKKPTKPPPPPPPPPKVQTPSGSCSSLPHHPGNYVGGGGGSVRIGGGAASEYAETESSVPYSTRSLQQHMRSASPSSSYYHTCKSESAYVSYNPASFICQCSMCSSSNCTSYCEAASSTGCQCHLTSRFSQSRASTCGIGTHSPCLSTRSHCSHVNHSINHTRHCSPYVSHRMRTDPRKPLPELPSPQHEIHHQQVRRDHPNNNDHSPMAFQERRYPLTNNNSTHLNHNHGNGDNQHLAPHDPRAAQVPDVSHPPIQSIPPKPKLRISRPKLCISPKPVLKSNSPRETRSRLYDHCEPFQYRLHMEQHVERVFKYIQDRQRRREEIESDKNYSEMNSQTKDDVRELMLSVLATKETIYLRSQRAPISKEDFEEITKLGEGFIGNVTLVRKKDDNQNVKPELYAMKKMMKAQVFQQNHTGHVMAERDLLAEADNEWIVKLFYSFQDSRYLYFILEYIPGGDMMTLLSELNVFSEEMAAFYIAEISLAVQFVHDMNYIHRDIKPDNILIDAKGHIKLTDFGLCTGFRWTHDSKYYKEDRSDTLCQSSSLSSNGNKIFDDHPTITTALTNREIEHSLRKRSMSLVGSPNYIAPEVLRQAYSNEQTTNERLCDWWSVGVILYEMVIGYCPFIDLEKLKTKCYDASKDSPIDIQRRIMNWRSFLDFPDPKNHNSPPLQPAADGEFHYIREETKNLIKGLLSDPEDRLCQNGVRDIQNHPFFTGIDWKNIRSTQAPYVPELVNELDTRHFEQFLPMPGAEHPNNIVPEGPEMPVNHFTYKNFWTAKVPR